MVNGPEKRMEQSNKKEIAMFPEHVKDQLGKKAEESVVGLSELLKFKHESAAAVLKKDEKDIQVSSTELVSAALKEIILSRNEEGVKADIQELENEGDFDRAIEKVARTFSERLNFFADEKTKTERLIFVADTTVHMLEEQTANLSAENLKDAMDQTRVDYFVEALNEVKKNADNVGSEELAGMTSIREKVPEVADRISDLAKDAGVTPRGSYVDAMKSLNPENIESATQYLEALLEVEKLVKESIDKKSKELYAKEAPTEKSDDEDADEDVIPVSDEDIEGYKKSERLVDTEGIDMKVDKGPDTEVEYNANLQPEEEISKEEAPEELEFDLSDPEDGDGVEEDGKLVGNGKK